MKNSKQEPPVDLASFKAGGLIPQRQSNLFSVRLKILLGNITADQMRKVAEISREYGQGYVHLTMRQGIEIPHIQLEELDEVITKLGEVGIELGACGHRIRVITSCQGNRLCPHGLGDTQSLALKLDEQFYGRSGLPHKFKIGVTGCPNSCIKPQENDVGFIGVAEPVFREDEGEECISCGLCADICPLNAIELVNGKPVIDYNRCSHDGKCAAVCPTNSIKLGRQGWDVYVGGKWGRKPQLGKLFAEFISDEEALKLVEKILRAYLRLAEKKERLGDLINRLGLEKFKEEARGETAEIST